MCAQLLLARFLCMLVPSSFNSHARASIRFTQRWGACVWDPCITRMVFFMAMLLVCWCLVVWHRRCCSCVQFTCACEFRAAAGSEGSVCVCVTCACGGIAADFAVHIDDDVDGIGQQINPLIRVVLSSVLSWGSLALANACLRSYTRTRTRTQHNPNR